jgi:hypothetical protein
VPAGSHLFLAAGTESGARAVASDYLIAGIRAGETCICCANRSWRRALGSALAADGLTGGGGPKTLIFVDPAEAYLDASEFTAERQLARLGAAMDAVGGTRLRIFGRIGGDTLRSLPEGEWWEYEMRVTHLAQERGITTMCAYAASDRSYSGHAQALHPYVVSKGQVIAHKTPL